MPEATILGAGLSGLATAILLARRGVRATVYDRKPRVGGRFHDGFQVLENSSSPEDVLAELARLGIDVDCDLAPLHEVLFVDARGRERRATAREPFAYLIRRGGGAGALDTSLQKRAAEMGVQIELGASRRAEEVDVVATGPSRADGVARELTFRTNAPDTFVTIFDPAIAPGGYSYVFVHDGWGTMGVAVVRELSSVTSFSRVAFERLRPYVHGSIDDGDEHTQYMNFYLPAHLHQRGAWHVGEAAGVQDFLFGLGNRLAFRTASIVADAVSGGAWDEERFRRTVLTPMRVSMLARHAFERVERRLSGPMCAYLAGGDLRERLVRVQRPTFVKNMLARAIERFSGDAEQCPHGEACLWCRAPQRR